MLRVTQEQLKLYQAGGVPYPPAPARPKRPTKQQRKPETAVVSACLDWLWAHGIYCWRNSTGAFPREYETKDGQRRRSWISFGHVGSPDIIGWLPARSGAPGRFLGVETKSKHGAMDPDQDAFAKRLTADGGLYICARSIRDLDARKGELVG